MIYVGTGQYLGTPDIPGTTGANASATSTQTMYALNDPYTTVMAAPLTTPVITPLRSNLKQQTATNNATTGDVTLTVTGAGSGTYGWYIDLPVTGERVVTNPALGQGVLEFTTNKPDGADPCLPGGTSKSYAVNYATGGYATNSSTATSGIAGRALGSTLASRPQFIQLEGDGTAGSAKTVELIRLSNDTTVPADVPLASSGFGGRRKSWREINVQ